MNQGVQSAVAPGVQLFQETPGTLQVYKVNPIPALIPLGLQPSPRQPKEKCFTTQGYSGLTLAHTLVHGFHKSRSTIQSLVSTHEAL